MDAKNDAAAVGRLEAGALAVARRAAAQRLARRLALFGFHRVFRVDREVVEREQRPCMRAARRLASCNEGISFDQHHATGRP